LNKRKKLADKFRKGLYINTNIMISDNNTVEIECCRKVLEYNDIYIRLRTPNMIVVVWGKKLCIDGFRSTGIIITGEIDSIEFQKGVR